MATQAQYQSRQMLDARGQSRTLALGQESGKPLKVGETWVTPTGGTADDAMSLADWISLLDQAQIPTVSVLTSSEYLALTPDASTLYVIMADDP